MTNPYIAKLKAIAIDKRSLSEAREVLLEMNQDSKAILRLNDSKIELLLKRDAYLKTFLACLLYYIEGYYYINASYAELIKHGSKRGYWDLLRLGFIQAKKNTRTKKPFHIFVSAKPTA